MLSQFRDGLVLAASKKPLPVVDRPFVGHAEPPLAAKAEDRMEHHFQQKTHPRKGQRVFAEQFQLKTPADQGKGLVVRRDVSGCLFLQVGFGRRQLLLRQFDLLHRVLLGLALDERPNSVRLGGTLPEPRLHFSVRYFSRLVWSKGVASYSLCTQGDTSRAGTRMPSRANQLNCCSSQSGCGGLGGTASGGST